MRRRRLHLAIGASAVLHSALAVVFWRTPPSRRTIESEIPLEFELGEPTQTRTVPQTVSPPAIGDIQPLAQSPRLVSRASATKTSEIHQEPGASPTVPSATSQHDQPPSDRLALFRNVLQLPAVNPIGTSTPESARLFGAVEKPQQAPPSAATRKVKGRGGINMELEDDGSIRSFSEPTFNTRSLHDEGIVGVQGDFDLTDRLLKGLGQNPYRYEQHRLAEATREERLCKMLEAQRSRERSALFRLKDRLTDILMTPGVSDSEKRKTLFELWDECLEPEPGKESSSVAIRGTIEAFIREQLPLHSGRGFLPAELALLNKRRTSSVVFDPYRIATPDAGVTP